MRTLVRSLFGALAVVTALVAQQGCSTADKKGGVVVAIATDLTAPKDIDQVGLFIAADGKPLFAETRAVAPDGTVRFPATLAVAGAVDRGVALTVRAVAFSAGKPKILRDVLTTIPTSRIVTLRVPLHFLSLDSAVATGVGTTAPATSRLMPLADVVIGAGADPKFDLFLGVQSICPAQGGVLRTSIAGVCKDANVDSSTLPAFDANKVFGGGESPSDSAQLTHGYCHDVAKCFASAKPLAVTADCQVSFGVPSGTAGNLALRTTDGSGTCTANGCFVPLDHFLAADVASRDAGFWSDVEEGRPGVSVHLPPVVCATLALPSSNPAKHFDAVVAGTGCDAWKNEEVPLCGPASAVDGAMPPPPSSAEGKNTAATTVDGSTVDAGPVDTTDASVAEVISSDTYSNSLMIAPMSLAYVDGALFVGAAEGTLVRFTTAGVATLLRDKTVCTGVTAPVGRHWVGAISEAGTTHIGEAVARDGCAFFTTGRVTVDGAYTAGQLVPLGETPFGGVAIGPSIAVPFQPVTAYFPANKLVLDFLETTGGIASSTYANAFNAIALEPDGRTMLVTSGGELRRIDRTNPGVNDKLFSLEDQGIFSTLVAIAHDASKSLVYALTEDSDTSEVALFRFELDAAKFTKLPIASTLRNGKAQPRGLAVDGANVYFVRDTDVAYVPKAFGPTAVPKVLFSSNAVTPAVFGSIVTFVEGGTTKVAFVDTANDALTVAYFGTRK